MSKILIVDDERALLDVFVDLLKDENPHCQIITASDGQECLKKILSENPAVVVSDIKMPNKDGLQMLEELRELGNLTPVIFVTGFGDRDMVYKAWRLGAFDFLNKPINSENLNMAVKTALAFGKSFNRFRHVTDQQNATDISFRLPDRLITMLNRYAAEKSLDVDEIVTRVLYDFLATRTDGDLEKAG